MYGLGLDASSSPDREHDALTRTLRDQGLRVRVHERRGGAVASIVDIAADQRARLIVVDASQRTGPARLLTGDAPYAIARHASCDVLLLR
jgi:nucleotide-binding universal stress UspA family protein